jgi:hypothetical protein
MTTTMRGIGCLIAVMSALAWAWAGAPAVARADGVFEVRADKLEISDRALTVSGADASIDVPLAVPIAPDKPAGDTKPADKPADKPLDLAALSAQVSAAWLGDEPLPAKDFTAMLRPVDGARWVLALRFPRSTIDRPGTYKLAIDLVLGTRPVRRQTVTVSLVRPKAKLRARPERIAIEIEQGWPSDVTALPRTSITIEETTRSTAAAVTAVDSETAVNDGEPVAGKLALPDAKIPAGDDAKPQVALTGAVPAGKTTGKLTLRSPQADDLDIAYEIRTHVALWVVALFLALGWAIGFVVRVVLAHKIERARVCREIIAIEEDATSVGNAHADKKAALAAIAAAGAKARTKHWWAVWTKLDLGADRDKLRKDLDAAKAAIQTQLDAARVRVRAVELAVAPTWRLPRSTDAKPVAIATAVEAVRAQLKRANDELDAGNATAAIAVIEAAFATEVPAVAGAIEAWRVDQLTLVGDLLTAPTLAVWPVPTGAVVDAAAARSRDLLSAIPTEVPRDGDGLLALLRSVHAAVVHADEAAAVLSTAWSDVFKACRAILETRDHFELAPIAALLPTAAVLQPGAGAPYLRAIARDARRIIADVTAVLRKVVGAEHPLRAALDAALAEGRWVAAAAVASEVPAPPGAPRPKGTLEALIVPPDAAGQVAAAAVVSIAPDPIAILERAAERERRIELAAVVASTVTSAVLLIVSYVVYYAAKHPATWTDLLGIAAQAFSIDIGVAALGTAVKNLVK